jgi:cytochrome c biogenesis protein CcdA
MLPLVPLYLICLTGPAIEYVANDKTASASRRAVMMSAAMFVLSFSTLFVALGASASLIGAAGLGIPFLPAALTIEEFSSLLVRLKRHLATIERAMGVLMVLTGIGFLLDVDLQHLADGEFPRWLISADADVTRR